MATLIAQAACLTIIAAFILGAIALLATGPLVAPPGYDEPPSRADTHDWAWIEKWEASRTPEATQARRDALLRGERP